MILLAPQNHPSLRKLPALQRSSPGKLKLMSRHGRFPGHAGSYRDNVIYQTYENEAGCCVDILRAPLLKHYCDHTEISDQ